jgi:hypothetical protein
MKHQEAITNHRMEAMRHGMEQTSKYLFGISRMLKDKDQLNTDEIAEICVEMEELQSFLDWLAQQ